MEDLSPGLGDRYRYPASPLLALKNSKHEAILNTLDVAFCVLRCSCCRRVAYGVSSHANLPGWFTFTLPRMAWIFLTSGDSDDLRLPNI